MAKTRTRKDEDKIVLQSTIQNRFKDMFSGQEEPPTYMNLRQVEALQARVAGLEAELARYQPAVSMNTSTTAQETDPITLAAEPAGAVVDQPLKNQPPRSTWLARLGKMPSIQLSFTARYTIFGALFGLAFPVFSLGFVWLVQSLPVTLASVAEAHRLNSLLWVIDTAPFFLGLFALFIGQREDRLRRVLDSLNEVQARQGISADLLQQRVRDLTLAVEVSHAVSERTATLHDLLSAATELIRERFNLAYTQIYLADPAKRTLVLRAGTGEVGAELLRRGHRLLVGSGSINGRAAAEKRTVIVADTSQSADFLPNPLLPNTHSEMAIPLIIGGQVVGVFDMQSEQPGALNENNLLAFEALSGQLAIAIQNVTLSTEAEQARSEMEMQVHRLTERSWQEFLDAIERGQKIGFSFDQTQVAPIKEDALTLLPADDALSVPIEVTGAKVGMIQVPNEPDRTWTKGEAGILQATAEQLAQHIEALRLHAQTEKYRAEAEDAVRRLTREGWDTYLQAHSEETVGYAYDLNEVHPLNKSGKGHPSETTRPLAVQDEIVGELSINTGEDSQAGANELLSAVASQLSAHIENLRLSTSNMTLLKSTEERAQREQALRQITTAVRSSTDPTAIMRIAVRELGSILGRKTVIRMATTDQAETAANNGNVSDLPVDSSPSSAVGGKKWKKRKS